MNKNPVGSRYRLDDSTTSKLVEEVRKKLYQNIKNTPVGARSTLTTPWSTTATCRPSQCHTPSQAPDGVNTPSTLSRLSVQTFDVPDIARNHRLESLKQNGDEGYIFSRGDNLDCVKKRIEDMTGPSNGAPQLITRNISSKNLCVSTSNDFADLINTGFFGKDEDPKFVKLLSEENNNLALRISIEENGERVEKVLRLVPLHNSTAFADFKNAVNFRKFLEMNQVEDLKDRFVHEERFSFIPVAEATEKAPRSPTSVNSMGFSHFDTGLTLDNFSIMPEASPKPANNPTLFYIGATLAPYEGPTLSDLLAKIYSIFSSATMKSEEFNRDYFKNIEEYVIDPLQKSIEALHSKKRGFGDLKTGDITIGNRVDLNEIKYYDSLIEALKKVDLKHIDHEHKCTIGDTVQGQGQEQHSAAGWSGESVLPNLHPDLKKTEFKLNQEHGKYALAYIKTCLLLPWIHFDQARIDFKDTAELMNSIDTMLGWTTINSGKKGRNKPPGYPKYGYQDYDLVRKILHELAETLTPSVQKENGPR